MASITPIEVEVQVKEPLNYHFAVFVVGFLVGCFMSACVHRYYVKRELDEIRQAYKEVNGR